MMQNNFKITIPKIDELENYRGVSMTRVDKDGKFSHWGCQHCKKPTKYFYVTWAAGPYGESSAAICNCKKAQKSGIDITDLKSLVRDGRYQRFITTK